MKLLFLLLSCSALLFCRGVYCEEIEILSVTDEIAIEPLTEEIPPEVNEEPLAVEIEAAYQEPELTYEIICIEDSYSPWICVFPRIHYVQIGANYTYARLKPDGDLRFSGSLGGIQALYEYRPPNCFYGGIKVAWRQGDTEGHEDNLTERRWLNYVDVQERLGFTIPLCCGYIQVTPFSGIGFHHLKQKLSSSACPCPLRFYYNEFYVPVGVMANYCCNPCLAIGLNFTWMPQFYPTVAIHPLGGARWILEETYNNFYIELPIIWRTRCFTNFTFILKPFYERWEDGRAIAKKTDGTRLGLPGISYHYWGIDLNFYYAF